MLEKSDLDKSELQARITELSAWQRTNESEGQHEKNKRKNHLLGMYCR
jgi:hypothetical protein